MFETTNQLSITYKSPFLQQKSPIQTPAPPRPASSTKELIIQVRRAADVALLKASCWMPGIHMTQRQKMVEFHEMSMELIGDL